MAGAVCGTNSDTACTQTEWGKSKQYLWDNAYTKITTLVNEANKNGLLTVGIKPIADPVNTRGLPTW